MKYINELKIGAKLGNNGVETFVAIKKIWKEKFPSTLNANGTQKVVLHHAIEQQVLKKYPGILTAAEMHSLNNLRGIPMGINPSVHLRDIRNEWEKFYKVFDISGEIPTKQQLIDKATEIDNRFGDSFIPPIR